MIERIFEKGILGTSAPLYIDIVTIYIVFLPLLLVVAIRYAVKKDYEKHYQWQLGTFILTLVIVVIFEIGVRFSGGFFEFMEQSNVNYSFMVGFLIFHIIIALVSVVVWSALIYGAIKNYRLENKSLSPSHKRVGKYVFLGMLITSITGAMIYYFLFIL